MPTLAMELIGVLAEHYPQLLMDRYKLEETGETPLETMEMMAQKRGCILPGKRIDYERIGKLTLDEFRGGKIGRSFRRFLQRMLLRFLQRMLLQTVTVRLKLLQRRHRNDQGRTA